MERNAYIEANTSHKKIDCNFTVSYIRVDCCGSLCRHSPVPYRVEMLLDFATPCRVATPRPTSVLVENPQVCGTSRFGTGDRCQRGLVSVNMSWTNPLSAGRARRCYPGKLDECQMPKTSIFATRARCARTYLYNLECLVRLHALLFSCSVCSANVAASYIATPAGDHDECYKLVVLTLLDHTRSGKYIPGYRMVHRVFDEKIWGHEC